MKKLLLTLGTAVTMAAPLATVVACKDEVKDAADAAGTITKPDYDSATQMLINDIPAYTHHSNQFGSSREEAIAGVWEEIQTTGGTAEEVAGIIAAAAYADDIEENGWEDTLEQSMIRLLGGTNSWGQDIEGWAYWESQRLEKDIIFADLQNTVKYEPISTDGVILEPGTDGGYVAKDGEILVNDWTTFARHSGIGDDATAKVAAVWDEIKDKIFTKQGFANYVGFYGYGYQPGDHTASFEGNIDNYLKDYVADNGVSIAFKDGTIIDSTIDVVIVDADEFFIQGGYTVTPNGDGTNTVGLGAITGLTMSSTDSLIDVTNGGSVTITATADAGYTINGGASEDFLVTIAAPTEVRLTDIDFVGNAGSDIAAGRIDEGVRAWHRVDWEATEAGLADGSITNEPADFSSKPISEATSIEELRELLSFATYGDINTGVTTQAGDTGNATKWVTNYQLENNVIFIFS